MEAVSPYRIPFEANGKHAIMVKAYDKAGNFIESKSILTIISPLIFYTGEGIQVGGLSLPWWLVYLLIGALLIVLGFGAYNFLRKNSLAKRLKKEIAEAEKEIEDVKKLEKKIRETRMLEEEAKKESERLAQKLRSEKEDE